MPRARLRFSTAIFALVTLVIPATTFVKAQHSALDAYAITNARIVTVSGPTIDRGTIVIRDGLIAAVGADVSAPADARVIDGAGLTVYPGLFDSSTSLGMPESSPVPSPSPGSFGGGPLAFARQPASATTALNSAQPPGLQPEVLAEDFIKSGGGQIESARNAGITTALTAPRQGIWMGQSALINLAGDTPQQMIVRSRVAMHVGFTPLRTGGYPGSLMGVFAALRQMLLDAWRYREAQQIYERSPRGTRRPEPDRSLAALIPVLEGKMPVVMYADRERDIQRALNLADEFKLRAIIAGGAESWKLADRLREHDVRVLLSLNLPRRTTTAAPEADPEPLRVLRERVEAPKTAAKLNAARVRFAFQSGSMTSMSDFIANAAKAIENGLPRDEALRALTIRPAEIFGVADRLGSIEVGKIANLTVTRGDLFDRGSRVTNVFIDGRPVDLRPSTPTSDQSRGTATGTWTLNDPSGTWTINIEVGGQALPGTLTLNQQGGSISGSLQSPFGTTEWANGSVDSDGFHFKASATIQGQVVDLVIDGSTSGDEIHGIVRSELGTARFTGTRQP